MLKAIYQTNKVDIFFAPKNLFKNTEYFVTPNVDVLMIFLQMRYCRPEQSVLFKFHNMFLCVYCTCNRSRGIKSYIHYHVFLGNVLHKYF